MIDKPPLECIFPGIPPQGRIFYGKASKGHQPKETTLLTREEILRELERIKTSVSDFSHFLPTIETYLTAECKRFRAGRVAQFYENWKT